ncbi:MAG: head GIN domain-containing protein [Bacteroidales bacterium]|jgi:hypothetical protein|nr:head GIN domain-containing protein [Bacteroidales bacterium]
MTRKIILTLILIVIALTTHSCLDYVTIFPSGGVYSYERPARPFSEISVSNGIDLIINQSYNFKITVEADDNLHQHIITEVSGNNLQIYIKRGVVLGQGRRIKVYVSCPWIGTVTSSGGGRVIFENPWNGSSLFCRVSGGGSITGEVRVDKLNISLSGGSDCSLIGFSESVKINSTGGSKVRMNHFETNICDINISGGGKAELTVFDYLHVFASGGSKILFTGNPKVTTTLTGGSAVIKL